MPLTDKTLVSKDRIRDNQRRSRARRRQLVEDLEGRLDEYNRQGTMASLEIQRAARAVNAENVHLRSMIHSLGASKDDISQFLLSSEHSIQEEPGVCVRQGHYSTKPYTYSISAKPRPSENSGVLYVGRRPSSTALKPIVVKEALLSHLHSFDSNKTGRPPSPEQEFDVDSLAKRNISSSTYTVSPESASPDIRQHTSETPCEVAAAILVELHIQSVCKHADASFGKTNGD